MKAIIVAAGRSSRLYPQTLETPKCLLPIGTTSIIERAIDLLNTVGVTQIIVVAGFHHQKLRAALGGRARIVFNPFFAQTENMVSLWLALLCVPGEAFLYAYSDVVFDQQLVDRLVAPPLEDGIRLLVDFESVDAETTKVRIDGGRFAESSKDIPLAEAAGVWTGLAYVSAPAGEALRRCIEEFMEEQHFRNYDTAAFTRLAGYNMPFEMVATDGLAWCEIDTLADLEQARMVFGAPIEHAKPRY